MVQRDLLSVKEYRFLPVQDFCQKKDYSEKMYCETIFIDEDMFMHAMIFYNAYMGYRSHRIDREEALMYAKLGTRLNSEFWKITGPKDEAKLNSYYRITPFHFFNNIIRFMDGMHRDLAVEIGEKGKSPFLDIGGGTGGISIYLAMKGHDVTYTESNLMCLAWMKYISKALKLKINILDSSEKIEGKFNFIIAKDIIEHVIDPGNFRQYLQSLLNEGGHIHLSHYPCCGPDEFAPMHFKIDVKREGEFESLIYNVEDNLAYLRDGKYPETIIHNNEQVA